MTVVAHRRVRVRITPSERMDRFIDGIDRRLQTNDFVFRTKNGVRTALGWKAVTAEREARLERAMAERGVFMNRALVPLDGTDGVLFSHTPFPMETPRFDDHRAMVSFFAANCSRIPLLSRSKVVGAEIKLPNGCKIDLLLVDRTTDPDTWFVVEFKTDGSRDRPVEQVAQYAATYRERVLGGDGRVHAVIVTDRIHPDALAAWEALARALPFPVTHLSYEVSCVAMPLNRPGDDDVR